MRSLAVRMSVAVCLLASLGFSRQSAEASGESPYMDPLQVGARHFLRPSRRNAFRLSLSTHLVLPHRGDQPTRLDFLQPGMMTADDEIERLRELKANPPEWVIWHNLPPRTVLAIWPHSDLANLRFAHIEQFIKSNYSQAQPPDRSVRYGIAVFHRIGGQALR